MASPLVSAFGFFSLPGQGPVSFHAPPPLAAPLAYSANPSQEHRRASLEAGFAAAPCGAISGDGTSWLFVQKAQACVLERRAGITKLTFQGVAVHTTAFTDRPYTLADRLSTTEFFRTFSERFGESLPNAYIQTGFDGPVYIARLNAAATGTDFSYELTQSPSQIDASNDVSSAEFNKVFNHCDVFIDNIFDSMGSAFKKAGEGIATGATVVGKGIVTGGEVTGKGIVTGATVVGEGLAKGGKTTGLVGGATLGAIDKALGSSFGDMYKLSKGLLGTTGCILRGGRPDHCMCTGMWDTIFSFIQGRTCGSLVAASLEEETECNAVLDAETAGAGSALCLSLNALMLAACNAAAGKQTAVVDALQRRAAGDTLEHYICSNI